ncbi:YdeI/OmpD-associated family protein [Nocardia colli]|uniref:YdeI/OmpD-associated family protein n=1 Tax=Nocardia colli TaxID=2545717 RepID=UPI0035D57B43
MESIDAGSHRFSTTAQWESWLAGRHDDAADVWLVIAKKGAEGLTIGEALDVALCFGWIDSHRKALDEQHFLQRYSPRRAKSPWSQLNMSKAEALIAAGRMREPGYAAIEAAEADGRWTAAKARTPGARAARIGTSLARVS